MKHFNKLALTFSALILMMIVAACGGGTPTPAPVNTASANDLNPTSAPFQPGSMPDDPSAQAVERYLLAKVAGDQTRMRDVLCSTLEGDLEREALSFSGIEASIEGMVCTRNAGSDTVTCTGEILAVYGTENRSFPLSTYRVVEEDGAWRYCGEAPAP